jgi:hypothetical protein
MTPEESDRIGRILQLEREARTSPPIEAAPIDVQATNLLMLRLRLCWILAMPIGCNPTSADYGIGPTCPLVRTRAAADGTPATDVSVLTAVVATRLTKFRTLVASKE